MFEAGATSHECPAVDSLSRAIDEIRKELLLWIDAELARLQEGEPGETPERFADRRSEAEITGPPVTFPEPETDLEPQAPPLNPRQRLDALARLLDQRLKQAEGVAGTTCGSTSGMGEEIQDGSRSHSDRSVV
jgi:hypothetical protein